MNSHLVRRTVIQGLAATPFAAQGIAAALGPYKAISTSQWLEDMEHLYALLRGYHRNLFHHTPEEQFLQRKREFADYIKSSDEWYAIAAIQAFIAQAGDGHSFLFYDKVYRQYPLEFFLFGADLYVTGTPAQLRHLLGRRVDAIDGVPIKKIQALLRPFIPQVENKWYVAAQEAKLLRCAELLRASGVTEKSDRLILSTAGRDGKREATAVTLERSQQLTDLGGPKPLIASYYLDWAPIQGGKALYVNFPNYTDLPQRSAALIAFLKTANVEKVIIDMRQNGGGNYTVPRKSLIEPLQFMPKINRRGKLFVLTGRHTFSAAMTNALDFWRETEAILIGEPTGARPNGYQELHQFELPNSRLRIGCSTNSYRFDTAGRDAVYPDLRIDPDPGTFFNGHDNVLQSALEYLV